jgi:radical SAM superfamily enzyme YgiQ (UPF0313 family)
MKIKTLLINPPYTLKDRYGKSMKSFGAVTEPMGLAYLAGSLESKNFLVQILDAPASGIQMPEIVNTVKEGEFDLVGITFLTPMFDAVKRLVQSIRESCPEIKIIVGGAHPSALPKRTMEELPEVNYLCFGEGEKTILDVVEHLKGDLALQEIDGLAYRNNGQIVVNDPRAFETDLDLIPKPARHLLPMEKYNLTASRTKGSGFCPTIIVARGCPFNCQYCSHQFGRTFRHRSVDSIIEELKELTASYDAGQVNFEADTLTINKKFVMALCHKIIEEGIRIRWTCESRIDTVDEEMLDIMKKAGCWQISYGVESGSQRLLDLIQKGVTKEKVRESFRLTKKAGITIRAFYMLGLPTETKEESMETIQFAKKLDTLWAQFTVTIPYPGTPMFNQLDAEGKIRHYDWTDYNTWGGWAGKKPPYVPEGRTEEEIRGLQKKAIRLFYMRPKVFLRFMMSISSPSDILKYLNGFLVLLKSAVEKKTAKETHQ